MRKITASLVGICLALTASAQQRDHRFDGEYYQDLPLPGWETETADRIALMGHIRWTTLAPMPKCYYTKDAMFAEGEEKTGIPYSGVHDFCGFVGKDISFHTFLSAVRNSRSSLYRVNYHLPPYDRAKAGPFYGTVCTAAVNYVMGVPIMSFCSFIRGGASYYLDDIGQNIDAVRLYDSFCYSGSRGGHIVIVSGIGRDAAGSVRQIETFEGEGPMTRFRTYSREEFQEKMIDKTDGHFYRFDHERWAGQVALPPYMEQDPSTVWSFNGDLSPEEGESTTYPEGKSISIDILSKRFRKIELYRNGALYERRPIAGKETVSFTGLPRGLYTARLSSCTKKSEPVEFQVAQSECTAWYGEDGQLYVGGCLDGVVPMGAYTAPGDTVNRNASSYPIAHFCIAAGDGVWRVEPNIPKGSFKTLKVNLAGRYSGYWAEMIELE